MRTELASTFGCGVLHSCMWMSGSQASEVGLEMLIVAQMRGWLSYTGRRMANIQLPMCVVPPVFPGATMLLYMFVDALDYDSSARCSTQLRVSDVTRHESTKDWNQ